MISLRSLRQAVPCYAAIWGSGYLAYETSPLLVGAIVDGLGLNERQAGAVITAELLVLAGTTVVLAAWMTRVSIRKLALVGISIAVAANLLTTTADSYASLLLFRGLAGFGSAFAVAAGNATIAGSEDPQKTYAHMLILMGPALLVIMSGVGFAAEHWGLPGAYAFMALWLALMLPVLTKLPHAARREERAVAAGPVPWGFGLVAVAAVGLFTVGDGATWSMSERIGANLQIDPAAAGRILGMSALVGGLSGSVLSTAVGWRIGRAAPLVIWMLLAIAFTQLLTRTSTELFYVLAAIGYQGSFYFVTSYFYGNAGDLDPSGRVSVAASGVAMAGGAIGPFLGGHLVLDHGFPAIANFVVVNAAIVVTLSVVVAREVIRLQARNPSQ